MHSLILTRKYAEMAEQEIQEEISRLEKVLEKSPPGRLVVANNKGHVSYYVSEDGYGGKKRSYIEKRNINLITSLGDKQFSKVVLKKLHRLLRSLQSFKRNYFILQDIADEFEQKGILTSEDTVLSRNKFAEKWSSEEYTPLGEVDGHGYEITATCGLPVRSKSEATIADILYDMGIAFKYEEPHRHKNGKLSYPDFKIIHPITGEIIIYEHFGRMDDSGYVNRNIWKLDYFVEDGFVLNETLIFSFETKEHPLSPLYVKRKLEEVLLNC